MTRTELIALMAASMMRPGVDHKTAIEAARELYAIVESRQPPVETPETPSAAYAHGKSDGFESGLDAAIAEIVRYADECNSSNAGRYARAGLNGVSRRIEALKSKPSQAAEGEKEEA